MNTALSCLKKNANREVIYDVKDTIRDDLLNRKILIEKCDDMVYIKLTCSINKKKYFEKFTSSKIKSSGFPTYPIIMNIRIKKGDIHSHSVDDDLNYRDIENDAYLSGFYNEISCIFLGEPDSEEKRFWKGLSYIQLCYLLNYLIENGYLEPENTIWLTASGELKECMSMEGLIRYYERMGFEVIFAEEMDKITPGVAMITSVGDLIGICKKKGKL